MNNVYISSTPKHDIRTELNEVHKNMINKYKLQQNAFKDKERAEIMTKYLQAFKKIGNGEKSNTLQTELEDEAIIEISKKVGEKLGIKAYSLFKNPHYYYSKEKTKNSQTLWGVDDVFEAELKTFLDVATEKAVKNIEDIQISQTVGNLPVNISNEFMQQLDPYFKNKTKMTMKGNEIIFKPEFRSGKTDVESFKGAISTNIQPNWEKFISTFQGANFTLKNYSSLSKREVIHLGNTNIAKAMLGSLEEIGFPNKSALHIFFHSISSYKKRGGKQTGEHIVHLRFAYELSGAGLYDQQGNRIDTADFFIYNDPSSNNIYVRSTKEMIANATNYLGNIRDPLHSDIIVLKSSF